MYLIITVFAEFLVVEGEQSEQSEQSAGPNSASYTLLGEGGSRQPKQS